MIRGKRLADGQIVQLLPDGGTRPLADSTDWARVEIMTEAEIEANAQTDKDNPLLRPDELAR